MGHAVKLDEPFWVFYKLTSNGRIIIDYLDGESLVGLFRVVI